MAKPKPINHLKFKPRPIAVKSPYNSESDTIEYMAAPPARPTDVGEIPFLLGQLHYAVNKLECNCEKLEDRLTDVLNGIDPLKASSIDGARDTAMGKSLDLVVGRINYLTLRLDGMMERLAL